MPRPADGDYYHDGQRTQHVAQGDIFRAVEFHHPERPGEIWIATYGILLNYPSGMLVGAEGSNRNYNHPFRVVAPVFELEHIHEYDGRWTEQKILQLAKTDDFAGWMFLPAYPGEFQQSAAALFRPELFMDDQLAGKKVTQLKVEANKQLDIKLAKVYAGLNADPDGVDPNMDDHWAGVPEA